MRVTVTGSCWPNSAVYLVQTVNGCCRFVGTGGQHGGECLQTHTCGRVAQLARVTVTATPSAHHTTNISITCLETIAFYIDGLIS